MSALAPREAEACTMRPCSGWNDCSVARNEYSLCVMGRALQNAELGQAYRPLDPSRPLRTSPTWSGFSDFGPEAPELGGPSYTRMTGETCYAASCFGSQSYRSQCPSNRDGYQRCLDSESAGDCI